MKMNLFQNGIALIFLISSLQGGTISLTKVVNNTWGTLEINNKTIESGETIFKEPIKIADFYCPNGVYLMNHSFLIVRSRRLEREKRVLANIIRPVGLNEKGIQLWCYDISAQWSGLRLIVENFNYLQKTTNWELYKNTLSWFALHKELKNKGIFYLGEQLDEDQNLSINLIVSESGFELSIYPHCEGYNRSNFSS